MCVKREAAGTPTAPHGEPLSSDSRYHHGPAQVCDDGTPRSAPPPPPRGQCAWGSTMHSGGIGHHIATYSIIHIPSMAGHNACTRHTTEDSNTALTGDTPHPTPPAQAWAERHKELHTRTRHSAADHTRHTHSHPNTCTGAGLRTIVGAQGAQDLGRQLERLGVVQVLMQRLGNGGHAC